MNFDLFKGALNETLQHAKQHMGSALEQAEQLLDGVDARLGDDEEGEFEAMVPSGFEDGMGGPSSYYLDNKESSSSYEYYRSTSSTINDASGSRATSQSFETHKPLSFTSLSSAANSLAKVGSGLMAVGASMANNDEEKEDEEKEDEAVVLDAGHGESNAMPRRDGGKVSSSKRKVEQERDELRAEAVTLRHALAELEELAEVQQAEKNALGALVREAEEKMKDMKEQIDQAEGKAAGRATAVAALKAEVERMGTAMRMQGNEVSEWMARVAQLEGGDKSEVQQLTLALEKARGEQQRMQEEVTVQVREAEEKMMIAEKELAASKEMSEGMMASLAGSAALQERVASLEKDGDELRQALAAERKEAQKGVGVQQQKQQQQQAQIQTMEEEMQLLLVGQEEAVKNHQQALAAAQAYAQGLEVELIRMRQQQEEEKQHQEEEKNNAAIRIAEQSSASLVEQEGALTSLKEEMEKQQQQHEGERLAAEARIASLEGEAARTLVEATSKFNKAVEEQNARVVTLEKELAEATVAVTLAGAAGEEGGGGKGKNKKGLMRIRVQELEEKLRQAAKETAAARLATDAEMARLKGELVEAKAAAAAVAAAAAAGQKVSESVVEVERQEMEVLKARLRELEVLLGQADEEASGKKERGEEEVKGLKEELAAVRTEKEAVEKEKEAMQARLEELEGQEGVGILTEPAATATATRTVAEEEVERLEAELAAAVVGREESEREKEGLQTLIQKLQEEHRVVVREGAETAEIAEAEMGCVERELEEALAALAAAASAAAEREAIETAVAAEKEALQARVWELEGMVEGGREEGESATEALGEAKWLEEGVKEAKDGYEEQGKKREEEWQEKLKEATIALEQVQQQVRCLEEEKGRWTEGNGRQEEVESLRAQVEEARKAAGDAAAALEQVQQQVRCLEEEKGRWTEGNGRQEEEVESLRAQVEEARKAAGDAAAALEQVQQQVRCLEEEKGRQEEEVEGLRVQLKEAKKCAGEVAVAHETAFFRMKRELDTAMEKGERVDAAEKEVDRLVEKRKRDMEEFRRLNSHIREMQAERANEAEALGEESEELKVVVVQAQEEQARLEVAMEGLRVRLEEKEAELAAHEAGKEEGIQVLRAAMERLEGELQGKTQAMALLATSLAEREAALAAAVAVDLQDRNDFQDKERLADIQQMLQCKEEEMAAMRVLITELEARLMEGERLATSAAAAAEKQEQTVLNLGRRLEMAEAAREQARQELVDASSTSLQPAMVQRASSGMRGGRESDQFDMESQESLLLQKDEEAREESLTAPLYRRYPILARLPPVVDNILSQVRRRFPEQTTWVEENVVMHVNEKRARGAYLVLVHVWLLWRLLF